MCEHRLQPTRSNFREGDVRSRYPHLFWIISYAVPHKTNVICDCARMARVGPHLWYTGKFMVAQTRRRFRQLDRSH
jgi:hypothetical protein